MTTTYKEILEKRRIRRTIAVTKLITAIESIVFCLLGIRLYFEPSPGLPHAGKVIFLVAFVAALCYIATRINVFLANQKIDGYLRNIDSMRRFRSINRQVESYLSFARWESTANGKK